MSAIPVTLTGVIAGAIALLVGIGEADFPHVDGSGLTGIYYGERYLKQEGAPPRIVIVETDGESIGGIAVGAHQIGGIDESADFYVWGAESASDIDRMNDAKTRWHRLLNALKASAPGRLRCRRRPRLRGTNIETYGEEFVWTVEYTYAVPEDEAVWVYAYANAPVPAQSPPNPDKPNGDTGAMFEVGQVTLENTR